jgi:hypothetical protein
MLHDGHLSSCRMIARPWRRCNRAANRSRIAEIIATFFVFLTALSCRDKTAAVSESIGLVVKNGPGARLVLSEQARFDWDTACVFGPYTSGADMTRVSGVQVSPEQAHDLTRRDDIDLLLFIEKGRVVSAVPHPRSRGDFGPELVGKCYARDAAVFAVRTPPARSWGTIGRAN